MVFTQQKRKSTWLTYENAQPHSFSGMTTLLLHNLATLWAHVAGLWLHILVTHLQLFCKDICDSLTTQLQGIECTFMRLGCSLLAPLTPRSPVTRSAVYTTFWAKGPKGNIDLWHVYQKIHCTLLAMLAPRSTCVHHLLGRRSKRKFTLMAYVPKDPFHGSRIKPCNENSD